jgi:hypothetical protein
MTGYKTCFDMSTDWYSVGEHSFYKRSLLTRFKEIWVIRRNNLSVMVVEQLDHQI